MHFAKNTYRCIHCPRKEFLHWHKFYITFRCQLLSSFLHIYKLILRGTNKQFSRDLYFSKIDFMLSFDFSLSKFFLIIFANFAVAGLLRSDSVSKQLIFEKLFPYFFRRNDSVERKLASSRNEANIIIYHYNHKYYLYSTGFSLRNIIVLLLLKYEFFRWK